MEPLPDDLLSRPTTEQKFGITSRIGDVPKTNYEKYLLLCSKRMTSADNDAPEDVARRNYEQALFVLYGQFFFHRPEVFDQPEVPGEARLKQLIKVVNENSPDVEDKPRVQAQVLSAVYKVLHDIFPDWNPSKSGGQGR